MKYESICEVYGLTIFSVIYFHYFAAMKIKHMLMQLEKVGHSHTINFMSCESPQLHSILQLESIHLSHVGKITSP